MAPIEPYVTLAFALRSNPGAYAVLLGTGVSVAAGVPSAWAVQEDPILKVAQAEGAAAPEDPFSWYQDRFGKPSTYDALLDTLTHTPIERQALLRAYFEPTEEEREQGSKLPTAAHAAVARLVASGLVRVILTINFDRLAEAALREEGVEPTVVTAPSDIAGLAPLHTLKCLVVHLHGDYLSPASMLNTTEELTTYPFELDRLLDRVLDEYGLIISGWSATWDTALRDALARCPTRRFATYWSDPFPLNEKADDLRIQRSGVYVQADADAFFGLDDRQPAGVGFSGRAAQSQPRRVEQRGELRLGALPAGQDAEQQHVDALARVGVIALRDHRVQRDHPAARFHCPAAVLEDSHATVVVPVVQDVLHRIEVAAFRHRVEEVPGRDLPAVVGAQCGEFVSGHDVFPVEQHPAPAGMPAEHLDDQPATPTTDVHQYARVGEVVGLRRRGLSSREYWAMPGLNSAAAAGSPAR